MAEPWQSLATREFGREGSVRRGFHARLREKCADALGHPAVQGSVQRGQTAFTLSGNAPALVREQFHQPDSLRDFSEADYCSSPASTYADSDAPVDATTG